MTMAVVRSSADQGRDYIAYFEPIVTDILKGWPAEQPAEAVALAAAICAEWSLPSFPANVAKVLLARAGKRQEVVKAADGQLYPNSEVLLEKPGLAHKKHDVMAEMDSLGDALVTHAREAHGLTWSRDQAMAALERLTEDFGADLAVAKRHGELGPAVLPGDEALTVVYGFARRAFERHVPVFNQLVTMVQGTMLVNTIYFCDVGGMSKKLKGLQLYLDTTPVLRALGLADDAVCAATSELLELARRFRVPMYVFPHTIDEITGVIDGLASALRRGRRGVVAQGEVTGRNREAIDALIRRGTTAGEIEALIADLPNRLRRLHIDIHETPPHIEHGQIDEERFDEILDEIVAYRSTGPREKDLKSLTAVDRLRNGARPRDLAQTTALFVTANTALLRASRKFFDEADRNAPVPHAISDIDLTAQLWVRSPHPEPDLPRKLLIADVFAALNPGPELWERWVSHIVRLQQSGQVSEEQVQTLIYHQQAKSALFEITHGDPDCVNDETVIEVIERFERELRRPAETKVEAAETRTAAAEGRVSTLEEELKALRGDLDAVIDMGRRRRRIVRAVAGYLIAGLVAATFAALVILAVIDSKAAWATAITLLVVGTVAPWAWGTSRPVITSAGRALIGTGALTAVWFAVFAVAPSHHAGTSRPPRGTSNTTRGRP